MTHSMLPVDHDSLLEAALDILMPDRAKERP
jgi:hypothetical protein